MSRRIVAAVRMLGHSANDWAPLWRRSTSADSLHGCPQILIGSCPVASLTYLGRRRHIVIRRPDESVTGSGSRYRPGRLTIAFERMLGISPPLRYTGTPTGVPPAIRTADGWSMAAEPTSPRRVLVLAASEGTISAYAAALEACGPVRVVRSAGEALAALREETFDAVLTSSSELLPLAFEAGQAPAETVLGQFAQGVCIVARDGTLLWSNPALRALPSETIEAVRQTCVGIIAELSETPATPGERRVRRRAITTARNTTMNWSLPPCRAGGRRGTGGRADQRRHGHYAPTGEDRRDRRRRTGTRRAERGRHRPAGKCPSGCGCWKRS